MSLGLDEGRLDDVAALDALDRSGMLRATATAAAQLRESMHRVELPPTLVELAGTRPRSVVVCGMGGSAIAGDLLAAVAGRGCPVPIVVCRSPSPPGWYGAADLLLAVSCSGHTRETLAATGEALRRGGYVVGVGADGSPLADLVRTGRGGFVPTRMVLAPRASLWSLAGPLLAIGSALGLLALGPPVDGLPADVEAAATRLEDLAAACAPDRESFHNPAKELAVTLAGGLPLVWGSGAVGALAALRLACQLAENAKLPAIPGALPEAEHNQVVCLDGVDGSDDFFRDRVDSVAEQRLQVVLVRDDSDTQAAADADAAEHLAAARGVRVSTVRADGASPLERAASLIGVLDFASVYLALLRGVDPTPVAAIDELKGLRPAERP